MKNILDYIRKDQVFTDPFPHIIAHDVLPPDIYEKLAREFPTCEIVVGKNEYLSNERYDYTLKQLRSDDKVSDIWRDFCEANASTEFFTKLTDLFSDAIYSLYPDFKTQYGSLEKLRTGIRYINDHKDADILLDAHVSINTPVTNRPSSVRVAHVDDPLKLYGGLLYFRAPNDDSCGGDLELYEYRDQNYKFYGQHVDQKYIQQIKIIPYRANTFVFFINSVRSLHGVTVRQKTDKTRQFVNLVGELPLPLFDIMSLQENIWQKRWRRYKAKITKQGGKW